MRVETNIADERPEAKILDAMPDPGAYVLELIRLDRGSKSPQNSDEIPDYSQISADARNCPSVFKTREEVDQYIEGLRSEW